MANGAATRAIGKACAVAAAEQIEAGFRRQVSPYGVPWRPLLRPRPGKVLTRTGRLRGSWRVRWTPRGLVITSDVPYAATHQYGRRQGRGQIPARPMVPYGGRLGSAWTAAFDRAARAAMAPYLR